MTCAVLVASFSGVGVAVKIIGVTQFAGKGVGVPVLKAWEVAVRASATAVSVFSGDGCRVTIT
jgi:hypothetical protein